jgi:uncharacterized protein (TIGR03437 family)
MNVVMRLLLVGFLSALCALAQFSEIAASDDGSQIYVTTTFVIDGVVNTTPLPPPERVFQVGTGQATLLVQPDNTATLAQASTPQVSGDGSVVGYTMNLFCAAAAPCGAQNVESFLKSPTAKDLGPGALQLSRNGQWALMVVPNDLAGGPPGSVNPPGYATLMNLQTGQTANVPLPPDGSRAIASDGSILTPTGVWKAGTITPVVYGSAVPSVPFLSPVLSDDASTVVYASFNQLISHDVASGKETAISDTPPGDLIALSANGRYILYDTFTFAGGAEMPETLVADSVAGQSYPIPLDNGESMTAGILNSSGTMAVIATSEGRVVQVALAGGQTVSLTEILPPVNYLSNLIGTNFTPGSLTRLSGSVVGDVAALQGKLLMDGQAMPIVSAGGGTITAQVPWEVRTGSRSFEINLPTASPFYQSTNVNVLPAWLRFESAGTPQSLFGLKLLTEDFSALAVNPLPAGAILHAYATGLGPVNGSAQTGVPATAGALIPIQGTITCQFLPQASNAQTLFAGLAPELLGVYQIDFQLADEGVPVTVTGINCKLVAGGSTMTFRASGPPQ